MIKSKTYYDYLPLVLAEEIAGFFIFAALIFCSLTIFTIPISIGLCVACGMLFPACFIMAMIFSILALAPIIKKQNRTFTPLIWDLSKIPLVKIEKINNTFVLRMEKLKSVYKDTPFYISIDKIIWGIEIDSPMVEKNDAEIIKIGQACVFNKKSVPEKLILNDLIFSYSHRALETELFGNINKNEIIYQGFLFKLI